MFDVERLHALRREELRVATRYMSGFGKRVLEIGAGDGFLASELSRTFDVTAIDIRRHPECGFPVILYDGRTIPFADHAFDYVFSSNVLEHIPHISEFHQEMHRILKANGRCVHIVPTPTWRVLTMLGHYPALPKIALGKQPSVNGHGRGDRHGGRADLLALLGKVLIAPKHGEKGNPFTEAFHFSRRAWRAEFERGGWKVETIVPCGAAYSGYDLLGAIVPYSVRRRLAKLIGSSTMAIVARPRLS